MLVAGWGLLMIASPCRPRCMVAWGAAAPQFWLLTCSAYEGRAALLRSSWRLLLPSSTCSSTHRTTAHRSGRQQPTDKAAVAQGARYGAEAPAVEWDTSTSWSTWVLSPGCFIKSSKRPATLCHINRGEKPQEGRDALARSSEGTHRPAHEPKAAARSVSPACGLPSPRGQALHREKWGRQGVKRTQERHCYGAARTHRPVAWLVLLQAPRACAADLKPHRCRLRKGTSASGGRATAWKASCVRGLQCGRDAEEEGALRSDGGHSGEGCRSSTSRYRRVTRVQMPGWTLKAEAQCTHVGH